MVVMGDEVNAILPRWKWPVENYARLAKRLQATNSNFVSFLNSVLLIFGQAVVRLKDRHFCLQNSARPAGRWQETTVLQR